MSVKDFSGFLLHGCLSCLTNPAAAAAMGFATTGLSPLLFGLANTITGNLASGHFENMVSFDKLKNRLKQNDPRNVNHDLERLFKESAIVSVTFIKKLFLAELKSDENLLFGISATERKNILSTAEAFLSQNEKDIKWYIKDEPVEKLELKQPQEILDYLINYLIGVSIVDLDENTKERLREFYTFKLPFCFDLAFKEALKNDDHGFKAFQIWVLEEMRDQNALILQDTKKILEAIENLSQSKDLISSEEFEKITNRQTEQIYKQLQEDFSDIKSILEKTTAEIKKNFENLYQLSSKHYDLSKQSHELIRQIIELLKSLLEKYNNQQTTYPHELNNIPRHTDEFIGRETELANLKQQLQDSSKVVLVNGIGGIGKTTLAKVFVQNFSKEYDHIAWVEIKQNDSKLENQNWEDVFISAFAYDNTLSVNGLHLQMDERTDLRDRFKMIIHAMKNMDGNNLLVIDNAGSEIKKFNKILPAPPSWHVLVTSRVILNGFTTFHLDKLDKPQAIELFKLWYMAADSEIEVLLEEIEYHTLMIEMLAKTLATSRQRLNIQYIIEQLKAGKLDDPKLQRKIEIEHTEEETNLFKHLLVTFKLSALSDEELSILKRFYFLLPQYYTLDWIFYLFSIPDEEKDKAIDYLDGLVDKGWLNTEQNAYSMHRLIQQAVLYQLNPFYADAEAMIKAFISLTYADAHTPKTNLFQFIPYAEYLIAKLSKTDKNFSNLAGLLNNLGILYRNIQQFAKAEAAYLEALEIIRKLAQENAPAFEPDVAMTLNNLGAIYSFIQRFTKAEAAYLEALRIYRKLAQENAVAFEQHVAMTLNNLGALYSNIQQFTKAEAAFLEALEIGRKLAQENAASFEKAVGDALNNLGVLYSNVQQFTKAEAAFLEALEIYRRLAQENAAAFQPNVATTLTNLGALYRNIQQFTKAEAAYLEALEIKRKLAQENAAAFEPDVAITLHNLGNLYWNIQQFAKAEAVYLEALEIKRKLAQENAAAFEPDVAMTLNNLGILYRDIQQFAKAEAVYLEALEIKRKLAQENAAAFEPDVAMTLNNLGILYRDIQQFIKAEVVYLEAFEIKLRLLKTQSYLWKNVCSICFALSKVYIALKLHEKSAEYLKSGLSILNQYGHVQEEANNYIIEGRKIAAALELDFEKFWKEEVMPEVNKYRMGSNEES